MDPEKHDIIGYLCTRKSFNLRSFVLLVLVLVAFVGSFAIAKNLDLERMFFQVALITLCLFPLFLLSHDPAYRLLALFCLFYYAMFGLLDYLLLFSVKTYHLFPSLARLQRSGFADFVIIIGLISLIIGYTAATAFWKRFRKRRGVFVWKPTPAVLLAIICWSIAIIAQFVVKFVYWIGGPESIGLISHVISNLSYLTILSGMILIITAFSKERKRVTWLVLGLILMAELIFGFFANSKEISFRLFALLFIILFLLTGKIYLRVVFAFVVIFLIYYAAFQVYRYEIIQFNNLTPLEVVKEGERALDKLKKEIKRNKISTTNNLVFLIDRIDGKKYVELITREVGHKVDFLEGRSLILYFYSFVPKMLWPRKPQISIGQLMNKTFHISKSPLTFVPPTQLGEFYWNFGLIGVLVGMAFIGVVLGSVSKIFLGDKYPSTLGIMASVAACYFLIFRFESGFASQYSHFTRVLIMVWIIDVVFRRLGWCEYNEN